MVRANVTTDEVICAGWGEPGGQWTQWGWRNEEGSWFHSISQRAISDEEVNGWVTLSTDLPGLFMYFCSRALTSSYVKNAT